LNAGQVRDRYPAVSPSGRRVLFGSNRFGLQELWTIDLESALAQRVELPRIESDGVTGCWSRDDRHVIVMTVAGGMNAYWLVALDGSATAQLIPPAPGGPAVQSGSFACAISPDGATLLYPRQVGSFTQLVLFDTAAKRERPLTTSASHKYDATWSPDGNWVAFATNSDGGVNVWRIPAGGGEEQPLTSGRERIRHFFYSQPDGHWLYLQPNHRNIYRMPAAGGARDAVTRFPETSNLFIEEPTISPDGRFLVYCRDRAGSSIWLFSLTAR
jgi:TolB protein